MKKEEVDDLVVEAESVRIFVNNNQLVQAHAKTQKIEAAVLASLAAPSPKDIEETDPRFGVLNAVVRTKANILAGNVSAAVKEVVQIASALRKLRS